MLRKVCPVTLACEKVSSLPFPLCPCAMKESCPPGIIPRAMMPRLNISITWHAY